MTETAGGRNAGNGKRGGLCLALSSARVPCSSTGKLKRANR